MHFWIDGRSQVSGRRAGTRLGGKYMVTPVHRFQAVEPLGPANAVVSASHLKCGVWAACALATVLLAGAKLCASNSSLEAAAVCTLLALVLIAGCAISMCGSSSSSETVAVPGPPPSTPIPRVPTPLQVQASSTLSVPLPLPVSTVTSVELQVANTFPAELSSSPPPYHIAVLLPPQPKSSPPPTYDTIT